MSTTPTVTPIVTQSTPISWLKHHERLIIVALVLLAGYFGLNHYLNNAAAQSETRAAIAEQALSVQKSQNATLASQSAQVASEYQAIISALATQNSSLAAAAASRQAVVVKNQATDTTLSLPLLAERLKTLGNAPEGTVSTSGDSVIITHQGAVAVTQTLETIPALQADLKDQVALTGSTQGALSTANELITDQGKQIISLNLTLVDQNKACKAQIVAEKAAARKGKFKWFKIGFAAGFLARQAIKTYTGF